MGFDRSGSACGNIARSDAQHGGYASGKTLHTHTGSANAHANRDAHSNTHAYGNSNGSPHLDSHTFAEPDCHAYRITDLTTTNTNIDAYTTRDNCDIGDQYS